METKYLKRSLYSNLFSAITLYLLPVFFAGSICFGQITIYNSSNSPLPENRVTVLTFDTIANCLWAGTDYGVVRIDSNDTWTVFNSTNSPITDNYIRSINIAPDGKIWVGTIGAGLFIFDGVSWNNLNSGNSGLTDDCIRDVQFDADGSIWIATSSGLDRYDGSAWQMWNSLNSSFFTNNMSFVRFKGNEKHVGTMNGGLTIMDSVFNLTVYTHYNSGLPDNTLADGQWDNDGSLWLCTPAAGLIIHYGGNVWNWFHPYNSAFPSFSINKILMDGTMKYMTSLDKGMITYNGVDFDYYNTTNSMIPEDHLLSICMDNKDNIWLGSVSQGLIKLNKNTIGVNEINHSSTLSFPTLVQAGKSYVISGELVLESAILIDLAGKPYSPVASEQSITIPAALSAGVYLLQLKTTEDFINTKKIVVSR